MLDNTFNVLFVCTGNSARSILGRVRRPGLLALPIHKLEPLAIQHEIQQIGTR